MDLTQLRQFAAVAQAGSFSAAADALEVVPSTVTRSVANLERSLNVRLLHRTTRRVTLTEAGERFLGRALPALDELDAAVDSLGDEAAELSGTLRVAASVSYGQFVLAPLLAPFRDLHRGLAVDLVLADSVADLVSGRIDVAIRHGELADSSLVAQRLAGVRYHLVASPDYLSQTEPVREPQDVASHACLTFPYPAFQSVWRFTAGRRVREVEIQPVSRISNAAALLAGVKSGVGLALLADWMVRPDLECGALVEVLPRWKASGGGSNEESALWVVMPSRKFVPAKVRAYVEFLRSAIST